jgi:hypothetical protein
VYVGYALYFYFSGLSLRKAAMKDCCHLALLNETTFQFGTDGFKNTNQERHYQKAKKINEFVILMKL